MSELDGAGTDTTRQDALDALTTSAFRSWYGEREFERNVLEGKSYFNSPSTEKPPTRHAPSGLLRCHRKTWYDWHHAPKEGERAEGIFWIGSTFEERILLPFLRDAITTDDTYVQGSLWIDAEVAVDDTTVELRGATDPAIVTADAEPLLVTEVKTTGSLDHLSGPKPHHRAQLHAYLYGLTETHDRPVRDGALIYGSRETLDIRAFHVPFDPGFWAETVVPWLATQSDYRLAEELPPDTPTFDWECTYCSYRHRCGKAETPYANVGAVGLLPLFDEYDRRSVERYLAAFSHEGAKLTPTLAHAFPDLASEYAVFDWRCPSCGERTAWDDVEWDGDPQTPPACPSCIEAGRLVELSGPAPHEQHEARSDHDGYTET